MPKFSANLTTMFTDTDFLNRFERASRAGFKTVEFGFPYDYDRGEIVEKSKKNELEIVLHNFPAGNFAAGERGLACLPDRINEFQGSVEKAIEYGKALRSPRLNCMSGLTPRGVPPDKVFRTFVDNLRFAAIALEKENIRLMIEPINTTDIPGIYLTNTRQAIEVMAAVNHPNIRLQYDIYHMQIMEGNLTRTIKDNITKIDHMQLADNPGRHEPGTGEINYKNLFRFIDDAGYDGWIGCEYKPAGTTEEGLEWIRPYLKKGGN